MPTPNDYLLLTLLSTQQRHTHEIRLKQDTIPQLPGHIVGTTIKAVLPNVGYDAWATGVNAAIQASLSSDMKIQKISYNCYLVQIPTWIADDETPQQIAYWNQFEIRSGLRLPIEFTQYPANFTALQPKVFVNTTPAAINTAMRRALDAFGIHCPTSVDLTSMQIALVDFARDYVAKFGRTPHPLFNTMEEYQHVEPTPPWKLGIIDPKPQHLGTYGYLVVPFGGHYRSIPLETMPWIEEPLELHPPQLWLRFLDLLKLLGKEYPYYARLRTDILQLGKDDNWSSQPDHYFRTAALTAVM